MAGTICKEQHWTHSTYLSLLENLHFGLFWFVWGAGVTFDGVNMDESCAIDNNLSGFWSVACAEIVMEVHWGDGLVGKDVFRYLLKMFMTGFGLEHVGVVGLF